MSALDNLFAPKSGGGRVRLADVEAPGFTTTLRRTGGQMVGGLGEILGDITGDRQNVLSEYAADVITRNPSGVQSLQDVVERPGLALTEAGANALSFLVPYLGVGKALQLANAGRVASTAVQAGLAGVPSLGEIGESQRETGAENLGLKYGGAGLVGLIENLGGLQRILGPQAKGMTEAAARTFMESPVKSAAKVWGRSALEEGAEELVQTPVEQYAGGKALGGEEMALGGVMGALGGLALGPLAGGSSYLQASSLTKNIDAAREALATPIITPEQLAEQQAAVSFLRKVTENDFGLQQAETFAAAQAPKIDTALREVADKKYAAQLETETEATRESTLDALRQRFTQMQRDAEIRQSEADYEAAQEKPAQLKQVETNLFDLAGIIPEASPLQRLGSELVGGTFAPRPRRLPTTAPMAISAPEPIQSVLPGVPFPMRVGPAAQPFESQFDTRSVNDFITLGQQIGTSFQNAQATGDVAASRLLEGLAQNLIYDRMAEGFGTQGIDQRVAGTPATQRELFGARGEPTYAAAPDLPAQAAPITTTLKPVAKQREEIKAAAREALAANEVTPEQYKEVVDGIDSTRSLKERAQRLEEYRAATRPVTVAVTEGAPQGGVVAGGGVDAASTIGGGAAVGPRTGRARGAVPSAQPTQPVVDTITEAVTTKETQNVDTEQDAQADATPQRAQEGQADEAVQGQADEAAQGLQVTPPKFRYPDNTGYPPAEAAVRDSVVDVMNGTKSREQLKAELIASGLPEGTIRALTSRLGDNQFSNTELAEITNAVQERSAAPVPVGERTQGGQKVGQGDTQRQEVAGEGQIETEVTFLPSQLKSVKGVAIDGPAGTVEFADAAAALKYVDGKIKAYKDFLAAIKDCK